MDEEGTILSTAGASPSDAKAPGQLVGESLRTWVTLRVQALPHRGVRRSLQMAAGAVFGGAESGTMNLIGRTTERARARAVLSSGREDLLLFVGARGVGKSSLLESIAAEAGANVVRFSAQEATWSYSGLSAIAAGLGGSSEAT